MRGRSSPVNADAQFHGSPDTTWPFHQPSPGLSSCLIEPILAADNRLAACPETASPTVKTHLVALEAARRFKKSLLFGKTKLNVLKARQGVFGGQERHPRPLRLLSSCLIK